jgi:hypothetical protein
MIIAGKYHGKGSRLAESGETFLVKHHAAKLFLDGPLLDLRWDAG